MRSTYSARLLVGAMTLHCLAAGCSDGPNPIPQPLPEVLDVFAPSNHYVRVTFADSVDSVLAALARTYLIRDGDLNELDRAQPQLGDRRLHVDLGGLGG